MAAITSPTAMVATHHAEGATAKITTLIAAATR